MTYLKLKKSDLERVPVVAKHFGTLKLKCGEKRFRISKNNWNKLVLECQNATTILWKSTAPYSIVFTRK